LGVPTPKPEALFFLFQAKSFRIYHDLSDIAPIGHPNTDLRKKMDYIFSGANLVTLGTVVEEGDIFNPENIAKLYRITQKLKALRGVVPYRIASITSRKYKNVFNTHDPDVQSGFPLQQTLSTLRVFDRRGNFC